MILRALFLSFFTLILEVESQSTGFPTGPTPLPTVWQPCLRSSKWSSSLTWVTFSVSKYCYHFSSFYTHSWHEANNFCRAQNGTLASIHDEQTNEMLSYHKPSAYYESGNIFWIGLNSLTKRGQYKWADNSAYEFNHLSTRTSTQDPIPPNPLDQSRCVSFKSVKKDSSVLDRRYLGYWFKDDCFASNRYICQRIIDPFTEVTPAPPVPGNCPSDWFQYANQKCIKYMNVSMNLTQAKAICMQSDSEMLSIHSEEEQNWITAYTAGQPSPYIGLKKGDYYFASRKWDDSKPTDFTNWGVLNDNYLSQKDCAVIITNSSQPGKWDKVACNETHSVICEKAPDTAIKSAGMTYLNNKCKIPGFEDFIQYRSSCYSLFDSPNILFNFTEAEMSCQAMNGSHLVSIVDAFEGAFLRYLVKQYGKSDNYWIGLQSKIDATNNVSQAFEWTDNWPVYYTNWDNNEPQFVDVLSDECVTLTKSNGTWKTNMCEAQNAFICKASKNPFPEINPNKNPGVCPQLKNVTEKSLLWVDIDKRSQYCYYFSLDKKGSYLIGLQSWTDASFQCRKRNGTLVSIHSNHDSLLLKTRLTKFGTNCNFWIGLSHDPNGNYVWEDGSAVGFTNWDPYEKIVTNVDNVNEETNRQCVEAKASDGMWKQQPCSGSKRNYYVCQIKKIYHSGPTQSPLTQYQGSNGKPLTGGAKASIAFGVIAGVVAVLIIGFFAFKKYRPNSPALASFENSLYASKRGNRHEQPTTEQVVTFSNGY